MQVRVYGKEAEIPQVIEKIKAVMDVVSVSKFYRNRKKSGVSEYGRVYVNLRGFSDDGTNYDD